MKEKESARRNDRKEMNEKEPKETEGKKEKKKQEREKNERKLASLSRRTAPPTEGKQYEMDSRFKH